MFANSGSHELSVLSQIGVMRREGRLKKFIGSFCGEYVLSDCSTSTARDFSVLMVD